ncbi:uncharacterized protein LOC134186241 [Corticium candelabrum]|uniref:uncharacterized protein LOC134186241 n=1 Tax=Corticium candelabrum TaxID=121492 RepID=UPI002E25D62F|nr:uncharacterized protein LOC134186241 [Corticium candelabrum]
MSEVLFQVRPLLWDHILGQLEEQEVAEIKCLLGESLIEDTCELQREVRALLEIWRMCRQQTDEKERECRMKEQVLPEPPAIRERLKKEVRFFIENIREKTLQDGRDLKVALAQHNSRVIDYVMETQPTIVRDDLSSHCSTASSSRDGTGTPRRETPQSDTVCLDLGDQIGTVNMESTFSDIHSVVSHLRCTMEEQTVQLRSDIQFLQESIDEESRFLGDLSREQDQSPTLQELRECSSHLEKDFVGYVSFPQPPRSKRNTHQQHIRRQHTEPFQTGQAHPPFTPNIPKSGNSRPNSAQKLRQMILETRETV